MGCGCGKKTIRRSSSYSTSSISTKEMNSGSSVARAQVYQSAGAKKAPQGPVTRKTV